MVPNIMKSGSQTPCATAIFLLRNKEYYSYIGVCCAFVYNKYGLKYLRTIMSVTSNKSRKLTRDE